MKIELYWEMKKKKKKKKVICVVLFVFVGWVLSERCCCFWLVDIKCGYGSFEGVLEYN